MELEEFISKTLVGILKGVKTANKELKDIYQEGGPSFLMESASSHKDRGDGYIKFDIAVTVSSETGSKGSAGIKVWSVGLGGEKESSVSDQTVSRIKFGVAPNYTAG